MNSQRLTLISVVIVVLVIAAFAIVPRFTSGSVSGDIDYASNPRLGSADAPVKVAIFFDYLCPHCATFSATVTPALEQEFVEDGTAALYFLNFPVVNPVVSRDAALVGECVYAQGNDIFTELEPIMLRGQAGIRSRANAVDMALAYAPDLDADQLRSCVSSQEAADALAADIAATNQLKLTGTPSVTVNGTVVSNPTLANVRQAIQNAAN